MEDRPRLGPGPLMGCTSNVDAFVGRLRAAATGVQRSELAGVNAAALAFTVAIRAEVAAASHGGTMRGVGRSGAKVGVGFTPATAAAHPSALIRARGPLHLLERDTRPHAIAPRRARALSIGQGVVVASVEHPGTRGKHPFEKGKAAGVAPAKAAFAAAVRAAVTEALA